MEPALSGWEGTAFSRAAGSKNKSAALAAGVRRGDFRAGHQRSKRVEWIEISRARARTGRARLQPCRR